MTETERWRRHERRRRWRCFDEGDDKDRDDEMVRRRGRRQRDGDITGDNEDGDVRTKSATKIGTTRSTRPRRLSLIHI